MLTQYLIPNQEGILCMYKTIVLLCFLLASRCMAGTGYRWEKLLDMAPWPKSYNYQMFSIGDTLHVMHPAGHWYTTDGKAWNKNALPDIIGNQAFLDYVYFRGALYGLGSFHGNIEKYTFIPAIFRTTDMMHWDTLSLHSTIPHRFFYHPFVFLDKIWILGGQDTANSYNDLWNSADGIHWNKVKDQMPMALGSGHKIVTLKNRLFVLGNDVWSSENGVDWRQECTEIIKGQQIFGYEAVIFDDMIWLIGCNRNRQFTSNVLYSKDGKSWHEQKAPWKPRGGAAGTVYRNFLWITGGKYGGTPEHTEFRYDNDLWIMKKAD